jgi:hypothetical protein
LARGRQWRWRSRRWPGRKPPQRPPLQPKGNERIMSVPLDEAKIRSIIEDLKKTEPNISFEDVVKRIRASRESQGLQWNEDLEKKIRYCIQINPT